MLITPVHPAVRLKKKPSSREINRLYSLLLKMHALVEKLAERAPFFPIGSFGEYDAKIIAHAIT